MGGLVALTTVTLAWLGGGMAEQAMQSETVRAVGLIASSREQMLQLRLRLLSERALAFLSGVQDRCELHTPREQCLRAALADFAAAEGARSARLKDREAHALVWGDGAELEPVALQPGQLAVFEARGRGPRTYRIQANEAAGELVVRLDAANLAPVFQPEQEGAGLAGGSFLVDPDGFFITAPRYAPHEQATPGTAVHAEAMRRCLSGADGEILGADYRGVPVIHGFRYAESIGGGCVMANIEQSQAFAPARALARRLLLAGLAMAVLALAAATLAARSVARPLARLSQRARRLEGGDFDSAFPLAGPLEVRTFAETFAATARSLRDSTEALRLSEHELRAANRLKDEFLATLSHELRTPLNAIGGWAHLLRSGDLDPAGHKRAVDVIERNVKAQVHIIDDLLDISRIESGKLALESRPLDLAAVARAVVDALRPPAAAKGVQLEVTLERGLIVNGDSSRLQQVIGNLLSNGIKFTPAGGRVRVELTASGVAARLTISDTGEGIDPEFLPFVFERFRQGDASLTRRHAGLGLGLAIVRQLVELHGGSVYARSEGRGHGSTFVIELPLLAAREEPAPLGRASMPSVSGLRVLFVEDDRDTLEMMRVFFEARGAEVATATRASDALAALDRFSPDVLVSDIGMPEEDGYALLRRVRARPKEQGGEVPAVALTAFARHEDSVDAAQAGFQAHVPKPVRPAELAAVVARVAGRT